MSSAASSRPAFEIQKPLFVGIDVGGTNIKFGLVDNVGRTLAYQSMRTEQERGPEDACERMGTVTGQMIKDAGVPSSDVVRAGLATPGPMDIPNGMILRPGNLPDWRDFPIRDRCSFHLGMPVTFANDANAAAYGEYWKGAGAQFQSMILLTLGTGIGGGIIVRDMLVEGEHSCGGECGHILVNPAADAPVDSLGKRGSLEAYTNATAVVERALASIRSGAVSLLAKRHAAGETITPRLVAEAAEQGDHLACKVIEENAYWLAIGIVSLIHTIDPDAVVLGGAMTFGGQESHVGRDFLKHIREEVRPRLLEPLRDAVEIQFASLGGDAGYIGSAGLARLDHMKGRK
jgi:glucokinase